MKVNRLFSITLLLGLLGYINVIEAQCSTLSTCHLSAISPLNNKPLYYGSRLSWVSPISGTYGVYLGENKDSVSNAGVSSRFFRGNVSTSFFDVAKLNLKSGTKYYWRVDVVNDGKSSKGEVNAFINPIKSENYHILRGGLRNSLIQFERNKTGRVAFLGGSITENNGWRDSICAYLRKRFPQTSFEFIPAGIGSMGSTPGAFRMKRDVLSKGKVDLFFEEAAVNDGTNGNRFSTKEQIRGMEGIARHALNSNPQMDIVFMYFVDPGKITSYKKNVEPEVIVNHDLVAQTYSISAINLAKEVTDRITLGEFDWANDFVNLHPSPFGQGVYARSIISFLKSAWEKPLAEKEKMVSKTLPAKIDQYCYDSGYLVDISNAELSKGWAIDPNWKPTDGIGTRLDYVNVPMLIGQTPEAIVTFKFNGKAVGISPACGPDAGIIMSSVDGGPWQSTDLFTLWSGSQHLPWYYTLYSELAEGNHVLRLKLSSDKNQKSTGTVARIRYFYVSGSKSLENKLSKNK